MNCLKIVQSERNERSWSKHKIKRKRHIGEIISCFGDIPNDLEKDYL